MIEQLQIPQKLAGNPKNLTPKHSVTIKSSQGEIPLADPKATRALVSLMDMNAVLGGAASHYGGPAAFAELMSAMHGFVFQDAAKKSKQWFELYHLINDAGHCENGLYALKANYELAGLNFNKLKKFRSIESNLTGHGESHLFPEGVFLSNGPLGSALPQAQGLAMADKAANNERVTITAISDGACMEGEAKEALAAIPGLAKLGKVNPFVLIISDNNTKLTGRIDKESFSMNPSFESLGALGWKVVRMENGHDLQKCFEVISEAVETARKNPTQPIAIHAKTIKGIGTKKTADSATGGHGFPLKSPTELPEFLKEIYAGEEFPQEFNKWIDELVEDEKRIKANAVKDSGEKIQSGISAAMIAARKKGLPVVSITSDLPGSTGVAGFRKEFPEASFDVGVAESNMISTAAGFSKAGFIPVVDTFAQFGVTKGALPITMANLSQAPIICVFSHTGFQDAADGASHQALAYIAMVSAIPHVDVYTLSCSEEAEALMLQAMEKFVKDQKAGKTPHSTVFFLGRENFPKSYKAGTQYKLGEGQVLIEKSNPKVTLVPFGSMVPQALKAAEKMDAIVFHPSAVNHPDLKNLKACLEKTQGKAVFIEDHQKTGGASQIYLAALSEAGVTVKAKVLAVNGEFGQSAYNAIDLYKKHGIDSEAIIVAAQKL